MALTEDALLVATAEEACTELLEAFEVTTADVAFEDEAELAVGRQLKSRPPKGLAHPGVYFWGDAGATEVFFAYLARKVCKSSHWHPFNGLKP